MVNVQGAPVILWDFPTMLAYFVAFPYLVCAFEPKSIINRVRILAEIFTHKVVDIFTTIANVATFNRTVNSGSSFNRLSANLARFARMLSGLAVEYIAAWFGACFWGNSKCRSVEYTATNDTSVILFLRLAIATMRTKLGLLIPIFHRSGRFFEEDFIALDARF